jgi:hypothetical protein
MRSVRSPPPFGHEVASTRLTFVLLLGCRCCVVVERRSTRPLLSLKRFARLNQRLTQTTQQRWMDGRIHVGMHVD